MGFMKPTACAHRIPCLWLQAWVFTGMGTGCPGKPQGSPWYSLHTETVKSVAFLNDGTKIVSGSDDNSVQLWDVSTGMELKELKGHNGKILSVAFSSSGTRIVSGSGDKSVQVWDVSIGVELKELKGHTS